MLRTYVRIGTGRQRRQDVITCVAFGRPHRIISTDSTVPVPIIPINANRARMVAGQSTSTESEGKEKSNRRSYVNTSTMANKDKKKSINLLRGWPSTSLLPAAALRAASQTALTDPSIWGPGLEYGPDPGYQPLREALVHWLGRFYGDVIPITSTGDSGAGDEVSQGRNVREEAGRINITGGASQSLACLLQSFTDPARTLAVWVVAPCYFLACPIFADAGFAGRMHAVPEDEEGVEIGILEREIRALEQRSGKGTGREDEGGLRYKDPGQYRKIYRHVIYCVPAFSNPSGRTMTLARRERLVELARRHDALIICDDVYDMLQWRVESPSSTSSPLSESRQDGKFHKAILPRVADLDIAKGRSPHDPPGKHFGHAVSNGSFSKLVAPGVRTGWTYSTADFATGVSQTGSTRSGGAASQLAATIVCELLLSKATGDKGDGKYNTSTGNGKEGEEEREGECQLDRHIRDTLLPSYARRHALLMRTIRAELVPLGVRVVEDSLCGHSGVYGGYFVWMTLPRNIETRLSTNTTPARPWPTARAIADRCRASEDLMIGNGELFAVHGDEDAVRFDHAIRLCFAWEDEQDLVDGVERLGRVIRKMLDEEPESWEPKHRALSDVDGAK